jgi:hypothetical protein
VEGLLGDDFGDVRLHADPLAAQTARELKADAFTAGRDVFFATGKDVFDTPEGIALLGHELIHVREGSEAAQGQLARSTLRRAVEENEAAASERALRRLVEADEPPRLGWQRPNMDLPDLGIGAGEDLRTPELKRGGQPITVSPGSSSTGVARAPAARSPEPAAAPREGAAASSEAESSAGQKAAADLDTLARQVYDLIMRRLTLERERVGHW